MRNRRKSNESIFVKVQRKERLKLPKEIGEVGGKKMEKKKKGGNRENDAEVC